MYLNVPRMGRRNMGVKWMIAAGLLACAGKLVGSALPEGFEDKTLAIQIALARKGISPGVLDGMTGSRTAAALRAAGDVSPTQDLWTTYTVGSNDVARLLPVGQTWLAKSQQERLDYETVLELVAEKSWSHTNLIMRLNPGVDWTNVAVGTQVKVPKVEAPAVRRKAAFVKIFLSEHVIQAFDAETNLLAHFPCSVAASMDKRPIGALYVETMVSDPNYTFNPEVFPESAEGRQLGRKLILPPGPNNPVGTVWIGLDRPGYGIHGTPRPEAVGRAETHGCFRLANWNAELLVKLVAIGTPVYVEP
jgi:lipoprotein-anchoring transpeptidase ErfK/SrfK